MSAPSLQLFFETPLIAQQLGVRGKDAVVAAALALVDRYTIDVSQPAAPRFAWVADVREITLPPGDHPPLATSPGNFWIAACCFDSGDGEGGLTIEDPRFATTAAGVPGLAVTVEAPLQTVAPVAGELILFQGFLRHGFVNPGAVPQRWMLVGLRPKPL
jgi:hypothetical protein